MYARRDESIADFTIETTIALARQLGIQHTRFLRSSEIDGIAGEKTARLIQILKKVGASHYISGPQPAIISKSISFPRLVSDWNLWSTEIPEYVQSYPPYDPYVSALDLLFMMGDRAASYIAPLTDVVSGV